MTTLLRSNRHRDRQAAPYSGLDASDGSFPLRCAEGQPYGPLRAPPRPLPPQSQGDSTDPLRREAGIRLWFLNNGFSCDLWRYQDTALEHTEAAPVVAGAVRATRSASYRFTRRPPERTEAGGFNYSARRSIPAEFNEDLMSRTPRGQVSQRQRAKAIRLLTAVVDDEKAALYWRVQAARSLLAQKPPEAEDDDEPMGPPVRIILPSNGRENIAAEREQQRSQRLKNGE